MGARFSAPVQTGPGAHPASYKMSTGSFPGVKRPGRGADHPPPPKRRGHERVELYFCSPSGPSCYGENFTFLLLPFLHLKALTYLICQDLYVNYGLPTKLTACAVGLGTVIAEGLIEFVICPCGICGGQSSTGRISSPRVFSCQHHSTDVPLSYVIHIPPTLYNHSNLQRR